MEAATRKETLYYDLQHEAARLRSAAHQRHVGKADCQPLREQLRRLNLIGEKLAELDYASAPGYILNRLTREELIAMNSMILHELFLMDLAIKSEPRTALREALRHDFGSYEKRRFEFTAMGKALGGRSGWVLP